MWPVSPVYWCGFRFSDDDELDDEVKLFVELCVAAKTPLVAPEKIANTLDKLESMCVVENILHAKIGEIDLGTIDKSNLNLNYTKKRYTEYFGVTPPNAIWGPDTSQES